MQQYQRSQQSEAHEACVLFRKLAIVYADIVQIGGRLVNFVVAPLWIIPRSVCDCLLFPSF